MTARLFGVLFLISAGLPAETPELDIQTAHGNAAEAATRDQLLRITDQYDLARWTYTRRIVIEQGAIPHSHPVLTLNTRSRDNDLHLLSGFLHEELHWYETDRPRQTRAAIAELRQMYPDIPVGGDDGAADEESSYLHIIVCHFEHQAMKSLVGADRAREVMEFLAADHYRAIYRLILRDEAKIAALVERHGLAP